MFSFSQPCALCYDTPFSDWVGKLVSLARGYLYECLSLNKCKAVQCVSRLLSSIMFLFITLFGCLVVWYFLTWKHPKNFPPGPRLHLPLLGNSLPMLINGDVYQSMRQLSDIYGDYCGFWLGKYRAVTIKDFDGMHTLLSQTSTTGRQKIAAKCKLVLIENLGPRF